MSLEKQGAVIALSLDIKSGGEHVWKYFGTFSTKMWNHPPACRLQCWDALGQTTNRAGTQPTCHQTGYLKSSWAHSLPLNTPFDMAMPTRGKRPCSSHQWAGSSPSHHAAAAKSLQSCLTLCDPRDGSPPGSPIPGILQARTLEWAAISFSNTWKWKLKVKSLSHVWRSATPMDCSLPGSSVHVIFQARVLEWGAIVFSHHEASTNLQTSLTHQWADIRGKRNYTIAAYGMEIVITERQNETVNLF